ncbi:MAG: 30S ribosome-binding factor RbfA [Nitrospiraceae bacterium]
MGRATYKRAIRVADQIRMEVADILMRRIKDPRVGFVTVTDVDVTNDLRLARIYITTMQTGEAEGEAFAGLAKAGGFIRAELGRRLNLRYTPELVFMEDKAGARGDRVLSLLENLSSPDRKSRLEDGSDPSEGNRDA